MSSTSPFGRTRHHSARCVKTGPLRICVPPLPKATPAATEGLRKMEPRTEWESRLKSFFSLSWRSKIPAPAKQRTCCPSGPIGRILSKRRRFSTTVGRSHSALRGTEAPVRAVLAPCGMTATSAATHALSTSIASFMLPGFTRHRAVPRPRREPFMSAFFLTLPLPTMPASLPARFFWASVIGVSQHARKPEVRASWRTRASCFSSTTPPRTPTAPTATRAPRL
mmetsp:Transcript_96528/g.288129  ORF Transcript_96528/g.288129 Transcript_96528/m.288129 type:complete len:224 (+) Transcript_96528:1248-1919(+)